MLEITLDYPTFKSRVSSKGLLWQYIETDKTYDIFAVEENIKYSVQVWKDLSGTTGFDTDQETANKVDFETNYKATANQPLEIKAGPGRPIRTAPSPQPINTIQHWKGYRITLPSGQTEAYIDVSFSELVYVKGAQLYCLDASCDGNAWVDIQVLYGLNDMVIIPDLVESAYLNPNHTVSFDSPEAMSLAPELKLRCYLRRSQSETTDHPVNVLVEYYK